MESFQNIHRGCSILFPRPELSLPNMCVYYMNSLFWYFCFWRSADFAAQPNSSESSLWMELKRGCVLNKEWWQAFLQPGQFGLNMFQSLTDPEGLKPKGMFHDVAEEASSSNSYFCKMGLFIFELDPIEDVSLLREGNINLLLIAMRQKPHMHGPLVLKEKKDSFTLQGDTSNQHWPELSGWGREV